MNNEEIEPAVEQQYEDPLPPVQRRWNWDMTLTVLLVGFVFIVVIIAAMMIF